MANFKFQYENILKMRSDSEEAKKNFLAKLNSELALLENELERAFASKQKHIEEFEEMLSKGCKGSDLRFIQQAQDFHEKNIKAIQMKIRNKNFEIEDAYIEYIEAVKERKIMEKLKEKKKAEFDEAINKAEEKIIEEIVNYKNFKISGD